MKIKPGVNAKMFNIETVREKLQTDVDDAFEKAFNKVVMIEGGYVDNPFDPGGKTKYGITEAVARGAGYGGDIKNLPLETAKAIYEKEYWDKMMLDSIASLSFDVAYELFDTGVNVGIKNAVEWLQKSLNVLRRANSDKPYFIQLKVDGLVGVKTLKAFETIIIKRDVHYVLMLLNGFQIGYYASISTINTDFQEFIRGWIDNRVEFKPEQ